LSAVADVSLATLADEPIEPATRSVLGSLTKRLAIESLGKGRWIRGAISLARAKSATEGLFYSASLRRKVREWSRETKWDAVLVYCSSMVQYAEMPELAGVPVVVDLVDVDSQKFLDYAELSRGLKRWLYRLEARRLRRVERYLPARAKAITLVCESEAELYRSICPNERTFAVPNGVDLDYFRPENGGPTPWKALPEADRANLVFVGALDYHANVDGVTWFAREVWPLVRRKLPHLTLSLVGRNPVPEVQRLAREPGIRVFGNVPDVRPHLAAADIAVAPLRIARGVQNKILEAMAMGKAVIGTPSAFEGLRFASNNIALAASNAEQWLGCILHCQSAQSLARAGASCRNAVQDQYGWHLAAEQLSSVLLKAQN
jgi:sugar transferase (PEP-CTERM/EpsH1 system associated)